MAVRLLCLLGSLALAAVGISGDAVLVAPGVSVEFTCTGRDGEFQPTWFVNGRVAVTEGDCYRSRLIRAENPQNVMATLTISSNRDTCRTFNVFCRIIRQSQFTFVHNTTLVVQGHLPSPESVRINESVNSSTIEWTPPYSSMNNDIIHVDPRITQYTVYITDNYTGNSIVEKNVTRTQFTFTIPDDVLSPMYQVSAWNVGGEGEMSEPVHGCIPRIPCKIATGNVALTAASNVLHIHLYVFEPCKMRRPNSLHITVMTSGRVAVNTTTVHHDHQSGSQVVIRIRLPQNVDLCRLLVNIRAGNSAGLSPPTEIEVECPTVSSGSISTTSAGTVVIDVSDSTPTTNIPITTTETNSTLPVNNDGAYTGEVIKTMVIIGGVIAVICGVLIVVVPVGMMCCLKHSKDNLKKCEIEMKLNQAYETVSLPSPSKPATQVHTKPCPAYENVVRAH